MTCSYETREVTGAGDWLAHNPEVAGSNPVPATKNGPRRFSGGCFHASVAWRHLVTWSSLASAPPMSLTTGSSPSGSQMRSIRSTAGAPTIIQSTSRRAHCTLT